MPPLESQLLNTAERLLRAEARADPTLVWRKRHGGPMGTAGDPDLYGVWRSTPFEIELKRPGQNPTILQSFRLRQWARAGVQTFVVHSPQEMQAAIEHLRPVV